MRVKEYLGIKIDYSLDQKLPEQGMALLTRKGFYKKDYETSPQESYARAATCYSFGDYAFAQRIYDYVSKGWFTFASPVLSNAVDIKWPDFTGEQFHEAAQWLKDNVTPDGMPISCFKTYVGDTKRSLTDASNETKWLSMMGGGIGVYFGNRSPDSKSTGVMAHARTYDADTLAFKQTASRRGSMAAYLDINHPEVIAFLEMRDPTGGDSNKKCFNLNHAVNITDEFMEKVVAGEDFELVDPKHGNTGIFLNAREVFEKVLELRKETGEPYIFYTDTANRGKPKQIRNPHYHISQSNLCVAPETQILTKSGNTIISELEGESVEVWNGREWSLVDIVKTGEKQKLIKVTTDSGYELECTPYHKFYIFNGYGKEYKEVRAHELQSGDKLAKFDLPVVCGGAELEDAYINGFYSGDGCLTTEGQRIYLYNEKRSLEGLFGNVKWCNQDQYDRQYAHFQTLKDKFFVPSEGYSIDSRLKWLAGYLDADGCVYTNGSNQQLTATSVELNFLKDVQMMLQTLGVSAKIKTCYEEGFRKLPANDGSGELKDFWCRETYRLLITSNDSYKLLLLGLDLKRLKIDSRKPQRDARNFIVVSDVKDEGRFDDTYCFTELKRGMGMFNGILTGQCAEISLYTSERRTAVCCLSSVNLEKYDEWEDTDMVADLVRMLDNVLEYFIQLAPEELWRAVRSARKERSVGLGTLGWHSYLQSRMIPFESGGFNSAVHHTHIIYSDIKSKAEAESLRLGTERGEAPDTEGSGYRNANLLAIAPNASSSSMVNVSPSIEPWNANAFSANGRAGSFLIKNKHLEKLLAEKGQDTESVWRSIITNEGSVQHLDFLTEYEKKVFKTAFEIDQQWVVELAAQRQKYVCQSQSLNIFVNPDISKAEMVDLHIQGWLKGVKAFYYCRAKPTTRAKVSVDNTKPLNAVEVKTIIQSSECLACEG